MAQSDRERRPDGNSQIHNGIDVDELLSHVETVQRHPDTQKPMQAGGGYGIRVPKDLAIMAGLPQAEEVATYVNLEAGIVIGVLNPEDGGR